MSEKIITNQYIRNFDIYNYIIVVRHFWIAGSIICRSIQFNLEFFCEQSFVRHCKMVLGDFVEICRTCSKRDKIQKEISAWYRNGIIILRYCHFKDNWILSILRQFKITSNNEFMQFKINRQQSLHKKWLSWPDKKCCRFKLEYRLQNR